MLSNEQIAAIFQDVVAVGGRLTTVHVTPGPEYYTVSVDTSRVDDDRTRGKGVAVPVWQLIQPSTAEMSVRHHAEDVRNTLEAMVRPGKDSHPRHHVGDLLVQRHVNGAGAEGFVVVRVQANWRSEAEPDLPPYADRGAALAGACERAGLAKVWLVDIPADEYHEHRCPPARREAN